MSKGYMYILECANGAYYTGSTKNLSLRLQQHENGEGANFTRKYLPVKLIYYEEYSRIDEAFYREKQVQGWSRKKKEALIKGETNQLHLLSECKNESHYLSVPFDSAQGTENIEQDNTGIEWSRNAAQGTEKKAQLDRGGIERSRNTNEHSVPFDSAWGTEGIEQNNTGIERSRNT